MAINHAALAADLGKVFGGIKELNAWRGTTLTNRESTLRTEYGTDPYDLLDGLTGLVSQTQAGLDTYAFALSDLVSATILAVVNADRVTPYTAATDAFGEWVRQLNNGTETFNDCPVTLAFGTASGAPVPVADYTFHYTDIDTDGKKTDLGIPDRYLITVEADAGNGGTRWAETLSIVSKVGDRNVLDSAYPTGTAIDTAIIVTDPAINGGVVVDGGFDQYTAGDFVNWERLPTLTAADVFQGTDDLRDGADGFCLTLLSDGTNVTGVKQTVVPTAGQQYSLHFAVKGLDDTDATATVYVSLRDAVTDAVITDDQGNDLETVSDDLDALVTAVDYQHFVATWAMPSRLPAGGVYIDIRLADGAAAGTAADAGTEAEVDHVVLQSISPLYERGVGLVVYSGAVEPARTDQWELTVSLTSGAIGDYFIRWLDRTLGLAGLTVKLPTTTGTPTILDSVIS